MKDQIAYLFRRAIVTQDCFVETTKHFNEVFGASPERPWCRGYDLSSLGSLLEANESIAAVLYANEGLATARDPNLPLAAVYFCEGPHNIACPDLSYSDVVARIRSEADIDFEGEIQSKQDAKTGVCSISFNGKQSKFFSRVKNVAVVLYPLKTKNYSNCPNCLQFEEVVRRQVTTEDRFSIEHHDSSRMTGSTVLGEGELRWPNRERHSDRYGLVCLMEKDQRVQLTSFQGIGQFGTLVAEVVGVKAEKPECSFDWFRQIYASEPHVGELLVLGKGKLFLERNSVGVIPVDERKIDWLNPATLHRCYGQWIRLHFIPDPAR